MKPKNGIKIRFQRAAANTNPQMDKVVLEDVLTAYKKTLGRKLTNPQLKIWRIIMKSPITKLAAAAGLFGCLASPGALGVVLPLRTTFSVIVCCFSPDGSQYVSPIKNATSTTAAAANFVIGLFIIILHILS